MAVTHTKVSAKSDGADTSEVLASDWNADHTIADATVTLAKMANIATDSLIGRDTASSGVPENITLGASLSMNGSGALQRAALTGDVTASAGSNATTLAAGSASNLNSGTLPAGRLPALTGDVTTSAGSAATTLAAGSASNLNSGTLAAGRMPALTGDVTTSAGAVATTIAANAVTLAKMATQADQSILGNVSGGTAVPVALTATQVNTMLGATYAYRDASLPTGAFGHTISRSQAAWTLTTAAPASGTLFLQSVYLPICTVTTLNWVIGSTALVQGTGIHAWMALFQSDLTFLKQTTDDTSPTMGANAAWSKNLSSTQAITTPGTYYIGWMLAQTGGTRPTFVTVPSGGSTYLLQTLLPAVGGTSSTSLGASAPAPAAAIGAAATTPYAYAT